MPQGKPLRRRTLSLSLAAVPLVALGVFMPGRAGANSVNEIAVPSLDSAPAGIAAGPGNTVWFVENTGSAVGRIDSSGKVTEFPVPPASTGLGGALDSITLGPDGGMWFTDASTFTPRIGRIDPSSASITMYELPTSGASSFAGAEPLRITSGPHGALWFAAGSVIGRIDTAGHATAYTTPSGGFARGITTGPDHAIWFTQVAPDAVGRLDPATGHITLHPLPSSLGNVTPVGITTGPDGALWFAESGQSRIGRLDVATGHVVSTATPTANAAPLDIVAGPASALWFTEGAAGNAGRIDLSHKIAEYPLSGRLVAPLQITLSFGGTLWIAEAGVNRIGRLDPSAPPGGPPNRPLNTGSQAAAAYENQCPILWFCSTQVTTGGAFRIKSFTQPLPPGAIRLTGYIVPGSTALILKPPLYGQELESKPVPVKGGLLGTFPLLGPIIGPVIGHANDLSISLTLAGPVALSFNTVLSATVPITLHLNNTILGPNCTIGPVVQHLQIAATSAGISDPAMYWNAESTLGTDNIFSVPGAQGCGAVPLIIDPVIDLQLGLPSASGNNAANLPAILSIGVGVHP